MHLLRLVLHAMSVPLKMKKTVRKRTEGLQIKKIGEGEMIFE